MMATNQLKYKKMMMKPLHETDYNDLLPRNSSSSSLHTGEPDTSAQNYQSLRFNARKPSLSSIVEFDEKSQNKLIVPPKKKIDLESFPQPRNAFEREAGLVVIKYNNQLLIQPKWMEERGTMCLTELWSMKQRKEFCSLDTKRYKPSSHVFGETTTSFLNHNPSRSKFVSHGAANYSSMMPEESKTVLDAKRFKMLPADKQGISYFRPEKMMQQADLFSQLKAEKQGMIITPQSTSSIVQNTFVNKLPLDLMYQQDSQPSSPSRRYQTGSSPHSKQASPTAKNGRYNSNNQSNNASRTNENSPVSKSFLKLSPQRQFSTTTSTNFLSSRSHANSFYKASNETQQSLKKSQNSSRMSLLGQTGKQTNPFAKRDFATDGRKQSQSNGLLGQLKEKILFNNRISAQTTKSGGFNAFLKRKNQQLLDQKPYESTSGLIQMSCSPSKTNFSESSEKQLELNSAINHKAQMSLTNLITKCNETLCEGHADQLDIAQDFDDILHEKLTLNKQIERREVNLSFLN